MTLIHALLLGIIQGLTEFIPISSSGHLVLAQHLLGVDKALLDQAIVFDLTLHLGTIFAVFFCYWDDVRSIVGDLIYKKSSSVSEESLKTNILLMFAVSIVGTAVIALPLDKILKEAFENPVFAAVGLIITSAILLISLPFKGNFTLRQMTLPKAFLIGIAQGIATFPGISRSGCTIVGGLACGFNPKEAARYSFLLSVPTIIIASIVQSLDAIRGGNLNVPLGYYFGGFVSSLIFGIIAIKALVKILEKAPIAWFSVYCFPVGVLTYLIVK